MSQLTRPERTKLTQCEATIARGLATFMEFGHALAAVREGRLYRQTHATFEAYCADRWELGRPRAYQLISAAEVAAELSTNVDTPPLREAHVRPLLSVPAERRAEVWRDALRSAPVAPDGRTWMTARLVEAAVERWNRSGGKASRSGAQEEVDRGRVAEVIDVESAPVAMVEAPAGGHADLVSCRCCGRDVEPDEDGDCPLCHEPEIALRMPHREELTPRAYLDDDGQVVAVIHGLNDRWISARGRHRVKSPLLPPRATWKEAQDDLDAYAAERGWQLHETNQPVAAEESPAAEEGVPLKDRPEWFAEVERLAREAIESEGAAAVANRLEQLAANILLG